MELRIKNSSIIIGSIWLLFTSVAPFSFYLLKGHPYKALAFLVLVFLSLFLLLKRNISLGNRHIIVIWLIQLFTFVILALWHFDISYLNLIIQQVSIIIVYLCINNYLTIEKFVRSYILIITIIGIFGVIGFLLALYGVKPIGNLKNPDGRIALNYFFTFTNYALPFHGGLIIRFSGYFDEPGTLIFFITHALLLNKISLNIKWIELTLIFCGVLTLSVAFYIVMVVYLVFFYLRRNFVLFSAAFLLFILITFFLIEKREENLMLKGFYELSIGRLEEIFLGKKIENKLIKGDNRSDLMKNALEVFKDKQLFGCGISNAQTDYPYMGANIFTLMAFNGLFGFVSMMLVFIYLTLLSFKKKGSLHPSLIKICIILFLLYLQRPDISGLFINIILAGFVHYFNNNKLPMKLEKIEANKLHD
jgi:hypothetical protein